MTENKYYYAREASAASSNEDFLEVGREYFLDEYKDETGFFVAADS